MYDDYKTANTKWRKAQNEQQLYNIRWMKAFTEALVQGREVELLYPNESIQSIVSIHH